MARARNIKPSFFANDDLADIAPLGRLLFIGLWTVADRDGRLEDRPRRIKAEVLPYDDCDVDSLLDDLQKHGFIQRYEAGGERFIQVVNFVKHQNPHVKESASSIPAPGEHQTSTVQEQCEESPEPEQAGLIPDSGFPLTDSGLSDSLIPEPGAGTAAPAAAARPVPTKSKGRARPPQKTPLPDGFEISDAVRSWAEKNGHAPDLQAHFDNFVGAALAKGYTYVNWDQALMNAIRNNWAKVGERQPGTVRPLPNKSFAQQRTEAEIDAFVNGSSGFDGTVIDVEARRVGF